MVLADGDEIWNSDSTVCFPKVAVMRGTFNFSQTFAPSLGEARAVPFCVESRELMQITGNGEHTSEKRADLPLRV